VFEWDEAKNDRNLLTRGFDFEYASVVFDRDYLEAEDMRHDYRERRFIVIGRVDDAILVVVHTWRGENRRIVSARPANRKSDMPIIRRTREEIQASRGHVDRAKLAATTDEDIQEQISADPDTPPDQSGRLDFKRVRVPSTPDIKALRGRFGMSQAAFADRFGFNLRTLQEWEQGRAIPDRPVRLLLKIIETEPETIERALAS